MSTRLAERTLRQQDTPAAPDEDEQPGAAGRSRDSAGERYGDGRLTARSSLLVLLFFAALTAIFTWPLLLHAGNAVEDVHDALLNTWILAWDGRQLLSDPRRLFDANIFYPWRDTLAFSEIILPLALLALPFSAATGNPILGYNLALLSTFLLAGFAAYLLVLRGTGNRLAGVAAGLVFAFNAYKLSNLAQVQLLALQWLPFVFIYLGRTARGGKQRWRDAILLALFFTLQALSSFYYAILSAVAITIWFVVTALWQRKSITGGGLLRGLLALALAGIVVLPFVLPYLRVEGALGFRRSMADSIPFSASLAQYVQALPGSFLYDKLAPATPVVIGGYPLDSLFAGAATLCLAAVGLAAARRRRAWIFPAALAVLAFALSLGPQLTLAPGQPVALPLAMPYELLYQLPGMQALRAPVRFAALVFLGLSILVGFGVAGLARGYARAGARRTGSHRWLGAALACLAIVALGADALVRPAARLTAVPVGAAVPPVYRWLAQQERGVMLELPMSAATPERGLLNQYFSTYHWQTTPDGYSGFVPPAHGEVVYEMASFPSERSISLLQGLDVQYLVIHGDLIADWAERERRLSGFAADIALVEQFGPTLVYRVTMAARGGQVRGSFYLPGAGRPGQPYTASLVLWNTGARSVITKPTEVVTVDATWRSAGQAIVKSERKQVMLRIVNSGAVVALVDLDLPAEGTYALTLRTRVPRGGEVVETSTVGVQEAASPPAQAIPAQLLAGAAARDGYRPGETVDVKLEWKALGKIDAYYSVFVRLLDKNGQALAQVDGQPDGARQPTLLWASGQTIVDHRSLAIPAHAAPGRYTLEAGVYQPDDLSPRLTLDGDGQPVERLLLGTLRVAQPLPPAGIPSLPLQTSLGGKATLIGYDIAGCTWQETRCLAAAGSRLAVTLYWRADSETAVDYTVFVHLADAAGRPLAQDDSQPRQGAYPTSVWQRGDLVADRHEFALPAGLSGDYRLLAGMYDLATSTRLQASDGADIVPLTTVTVR